MAAVPDCWTAYGATNLELASYPPDPRLAVRAGWLVTSAQLTLAALLLAVLAGDVALPWRVLLVAALGAVLGSAAVSLLRLLGTARRVMARPAALRLTRALGPTETVAWHNVAEIALVDTPTRQAVGLRLRAQSPTRLPAWVRAAQRRVSSGCDVLLFPADGDRELLGRVLLRYCIDPQARRRLPPDAP